MGIFRNICYGYKSCFKREVEFGKRSGFIKKKGKGDPVAEKEPQKQKPASFYYFFERDIIFSKEKKRRNDPCSFSSKIYS